MRAETISVRLSAEEKDMLDRYHSTRRALSRAGCFKQMLLDASRAGDGMRNREELDREIQQRAATITLNGSTATSNGHWMALVALVWVQNRLYGWGGAIEAARKIVAEVNETKEANGGS